MKKYSASLRNGTINSYVVEFRHPILKDKFGKQGRKIRKGIGSDKSEAELLVKDINSILDDESLWSLTKQKFAEKIFHAKAVEIFYRQMEEDVTDDPWELRNKFITIPTKYEGYSKLIFLGTTGAGKTTEIRQMIGTDPDEISFPAISSSRTTTCNAEYIFKLGKWESIVTFNSQSQTIKLIEECVWEAFKKAAIGEDDKTIARALLSHPEQRFRLSYFLGQYRESDRAINNIVDQISDIPYPDVSELQEELKYIIDQIKKLVEVANQAYTPNENEIEEAIDVLYEEFIREETEIFNDLIDHILELIKQRFDVIKSGKFYRDTRGWPIYWFDKSDHKMEILSMMRWFAGNEGRRFGQLLAPIVNGIRIQGPFKPSWWEEEDVPALVLMDGEGIGHDSNIITSLPIEVTNRFKDVDAIVLVDNATQPMLEVPKVIIKDVATRGHQDKLMITYTRFDQVEGSNLIDEEDKKEHVLSIQVGAIEALQETYSLHPKMIRQMRDHLKENTFFFPHTNQLKDQSKELTTEMKLFIESVIQKVNQNHRGHNQVMPIYDFSKILLVITSTRAVFMEKWLTILGFPTVSSEAKKQPWSRIKALTNRLANWPNMHSYRDLEPASDLVSYLIQFLSEFLNSPKGWTNDDASDEDKQKVVRYLSSRVSDRLNIIIIQRLKIKQYENWLKAYNFKGTGSAAERASEIRKIYETVIPQPQIAYNVAVNDFSEQIINIVKEELEKMETELESLKNLEE